MQKTFKLHWLTGDPETVHGYDIADAIRKAGYGGGAMGVLDYWEEVKDQPQDTTLVPIMKRIDILTADLCDEIDDLKEAVEYWKEKYEKERAEVDRMVSERLIDSQNGVKTALALAFAFQEKEDGSLSIPKENREILANKLAINKLDQP